MQPRFASRPAILFGLVLLAFTMAGAGCAPAAPADPVAQRVMITFWSQPDDGFPSESNPAPGIDLDGLVSLGATDRCDDDWDYERGATLGVDNAYATLLVLLADTDLGGTTHGVATAVPAQLEAGEGLYGFEVEPPAEDDPTGPVHITLLSFAASEPLDLDRRMRLMVPGGLTATVLERVEATYVEGRWRAEFASLDVPMGPVLGLRPVRGIVVDFDLEEGRLVRADLGGRVSMETAVGVGVDATGMSEADVTELLDSVAVTDLEPNEDGSACAAISFGVGLELAPLAP